MEPIGQAVVEPVLGKRLREKSVAEPRNLRYTEPTEQAVVEPVLGERLGGKIVPETRELRYTEPIEQAVSVVEPVSGERLGEKSVAEPRELRYTEPIEQAVVEPVLGESLGGKIVPEPRKLRCTEPIEQAVFEPVFGECLGGKSVAETRKLRYTEPIGQAVSVVEPTLKKHLGEEISARWLALRLIDGDSSLADEIERFFGKNPNDIEEVSGAVERAKSLLAENGITSDCLKDRIVSCIMRNAEEVCGECCRSGGCRGTFSRADKILTSRAFGYPIMLLMLLLIFWITIVGANYPSELLSTALFWLGDRLGELLGALNAPEWLRGLLVDGAYRVLAWVVAVMLPPMAIFFPLFTLLEDLGYLPRVAYNLDKPFCKCRACGKQALTMCMGFGCNAAGIVGCRIIDSKRERLIAMLTNAFVPCNGRFPMILTVISLFFVGGAMGFAGSLLSAAALTGVIVLGVAMTFLVSKILSATILRGEPSSFTLELPPFRKPQFGKILVRSLLDRTVFVLGRAAAVAAPAGLAIWLLANVSVDGSTLLSLVTGFLDPFGRFIGMDGVILTAFLLGLPANEIVIPLIVMTYMQQGSLAELAPAQMLELFTANGWTPVTAVCVIIFTLMHFPCSTSLLTIKKEAGGWKWAALAFVIPTVCGVVICAVIANLARIF
ncbi:MAG: ferrous iron transport protein B [Lachnospiraceae bacterium]|nr:ferrous iron transport protein B [Ruminococcus sp.]MCM1274336.1 ferrous iron transport protein B [Lachnospiraceae bacterium]